MLSHEDLNEVNTEDEIENTNLVDSLCEEYDILEKPHLPDFKCPEGYNPAEYLRQLCRDGWKDKIATDVDKSEHQKYVDRIKYELDVFKVLIYLVTF